MSKPKVLLIDMDDTLFDEGSYVESGFKAVARYLEQERDLPSDYSFPSMMAFLNLEGRGQVFDRIIERFEVRGAAGLVEKCVQIYRNHEPDICVYDGVEATLATLSAQHELALVTNGLELMQEKKLTALGIEAHFKCVVYCDSIGSPKPDPNGLLRALQALGATTTDALMIGDNPSTDGKAALTAGVDFLRVRTDRFSHLVSAAPEVPNFAAVPKMLRAV